MANSAMKQSKARALEALLDSKTLTEAAEKAGISRKTLYGYMRDDEDFAMAYKAKQERQTLERLEEFEGQRRRALETISAIMDDTEQPGAVRLKAAAAILEAGRELDRQADVIARQNIAATKDPFDFLGKADVYSEIGAAKIPKR